MRSSFLCAKTQNTCCSPVRNLPEGEHDSIKIGPGQGNSDEWIEREGQIYFNVHLYLKQGWGQEWKHSMTAICSDKSEIIHCCIDNR